MRHILANYTIVQIGKAFSSRCGKSRLPSNHKKRKKKKKKKKKKGAGKGFQN